MSTASVWCGENKHGTIHACDHVDCRGVSVTRMIVVLRPPTSVRTSCHVPLPQYVLDAWPSLSRMDDEINNKTEQVLRHVCSYACRHVCWSLRERREPGQCFFSCQFLSPLAHISLIADLGACGRHDVRLDRLEVGLSGVVSVSETSFFLYSMRLVSYTSV
jgi:hypothetical protein